MLSREKLRGTCGDRVVGRAGGVFRGLEGGMLGYLQSLDCQDTLYMIGCYFVMRVVWLCYFVGRSFAKSSCFDFVHRARVSRLAPPAPSGLFVLF